MKKLLILLVLPFFVLPTSVYAQSFSFEPSGIEVNPTGSEFVLYLENESSTNAANIHIVFNEDIQITNFVRANNTNFLFLAEDCGDDFYTQNELCFSVASTANVFNTKQELGTVTLTSATNEILSFETGERSSVVVGGREIYLVESTLNQPNTQEDSQVNDSVDDTATQEVGTDTTSESIGGTQLSLIVGLLAFVFISGGLYMFFKSK